MPEEPISGQLGDAFQGSRLLEQVSRAGDHFHAFLAMQGPQSLTIKLQHHGILATHDQERRRGHALERRTGQIGPTAS
jgi:hypothetical protein